MNITIKFQLSYKGTLSSDTLNMILKVQKRIRNTNTNTNTSKRSLNERKKTPTEEEKMAKIIVN
jgi:hypothetical protein